MGAHIASVLVLVLDEATSALDSDTESRVISSILSIEPKPTLLMVAHRLSTLESCSKVVMIENEYILQEGKLDEIRKLSQKESSGSKLNMVYNDPMDADDHPHIIHQSNRFNLGRILSSLIMLLQPNASPRGK